MVSFPHSHDEFPSADDQVPATAQVPSRDHQTLLLYSILVAQLLGNLSAGSLIDLIGRCLTIIGFLAMATIGALFEIYFDRMSIPLLLLSSCARNFVFMGAWGALFSTLNSEVGRNHILLDLR